MTIGEKIKKLRTEKNLTQKNLGKLTGISEVMIGQYERGIRNPKMNVLKKIAAALGETLDYFADEENGLSKEDMWFKITLENIRKESTENNLFVSLLRVSGCEYQYVPKIYDDQKDIWYNKEPYHKIIYQKQEVHISGDSWEKLKKDLIEFAQFKILQFSKSTDED